MVSVIQRMRTLRSLLAIRLGPGAAILPPTVTRIHMDFASHIENGHRGAKKFWRTVLPRLKYHNPAIPMTTNRTLDQEGPATLTIHFTSPSTASASSPPVNSTTNTQTSTASPTPSQPGPPTETTKVINIKNRNQTEILAQVMEITKAKAVKPTAEEMRELRELEEYRERAKGDRERMMKVNAERKKEEAVLVQARGEVEAMNEG